MEYSDVTVLIPVKDEPAVETVTRDVIRALPGCKVIVAHKGELDMKFRHKNLRVVKQKSSGKGAACLEAVKLIDTKVMCIIDGDDTYEVNDLKKLISLVHQSADMALGNRFVNIKQKAMPTYIQIGNHILTITANLIYGMNIHDSQTGIRAMKTSSFNRMGLHETHFGIETEMNVRAAQKKMKVVETPAKYYERVGSSKQMKLIDGIKLFLINFRFLGK